MVSHGCRLRSNHHHKSDAKAAKHGRRGNGAITVGRDSLFDSLYFSNVVYFGTYSHSIHFPEVLRVGFGAFGGREVVIDAIRIVSQHLLDARSR